jgi:hypothetical protein
MSVIHAGNPPSDWEDGKEVHTIVFHNFESLSSEKGEFVWSPTFNCYGRELRLKLYPGGHIAAEEGYTSLFLENCSDTEISVYYSFAIRNSSGEYVACTKREAARTFDSVNRWGRPDFVPRALIMDGNVLKYGSLIVEVCMRREHCLNFIPKNPFMQKMLQLFSAKEKTDISFKVESPPLADASESSSTDFGEVFSAHKLVLETCAEGSYLASLCENFVGLEPVPIHDLRPRVFHLMLRYIYGGKITSSEWKDHGADLLEASDKYGLTTLKIEAESWYVKHFQFSADNVIEAVAYADKMNCFLLKEAAINFIVVNVDKVRSSGTLKDIPETKDIMSEIFFSVATMSKKGQKRKHDDDCLNDYSINDLRALLAWEGEDVDGSRETLIARLKRGGKRSV